MLADVPVCNAASTIRFKLAKERQKHNLAPSVDETHHLFGRDAVERPFVHVSAG